MALQIGFGRRSAEHLGVGVDEGQVLLLLGCEAGRRISDADNIGLGFWTHQLQAAVGWYPWKERGTAVVGAFTYEFNQEVEDSDVTPGQRASFNLGVSQYVPLGQSGFLLELGALGYGQWQVTDDTGSEAFRPNVHDQIYGIGPQIGVTYLPWKAAGTFKWTHDFGVRDRFEGENFTLNFAVAF